MSCVPQRPQGHARQVTPCVASDRSTSASISRCSAADPHVVTSQHAQISRVPWRGQQPTCATAALPFPRVSPSTVLGGDPVLDLPHGPGVLLLRGRSAFHRTRCSPGIRALVHGQRVVVPAPRTCVINDHRCLLTCFRCPLPRICARCGATTCAPNQRPTRCPSAKAVGCGARGGSRCTCPISAKASSSTAHVAAGELVVSRHRPHRSSSAVFKRYSRLYSSR
jgi:hypothetical protein